MTKVVFVGEIFYSELGVGGGPIMPSPGSPSHPWVPPGAGSPSHPWVPPGPGPSHPIVIPGVPPGSPGSPEHPIYVPIYPDQGLPAAPPGYWGGASPHPGHPWVPPQGETVPPNVMPPPPTPPDEYADDIIVQVYMPGKGWKTTAYDIAPDQGAPAPTPHKK